MLLNTRFRIGYPFDLGPMIKYSVTFKTFSIETKFSYKLEQSHSHSDMESLPHHSIFATLNISSSGSTVEVYQYFCKKEKIEVKLST